MKCEWFKKKWSLLLSLIFSIGVAFSPATVFAEAPTEVLLPDAGEVQAIMKKVCDWQLPRNERPFLKRIYDAITGRTYLHRRNDWTSGAFYAGVMATYQATADKRYLEAVREWAARNKWQLGPEVRNADDHCAGQSYLELYVIDPDPRLLVSVRDNLQTVMNQPRSGREDWHWCDALFMSPPLWVRMYGVTGDRRYLDTMNRMWWESAEFLYDWEERLFFRDKRFKILAEGSGLREKNGRKIFWGRGNGWVLAGIVRVLDFMPVDYPARGKYIRLYRDMAERIASLQGRDGLWRTSLLDPGSYPDKETSGTGFFCYALAWGINQGILERKKYLPVVSKAWAGLVDCVDASGRLGWVQRSSDRPGPVKAEDNTNYGAGAFLLAGSEMVKLAKTVIINNEAWLSFPVCNLQISGGIFL